MAAYITVGATTTHGGKVISGSPHTTHNGIPISRKGDKVICKKCKKVTTILTGDASFIVDGAPIARAGDVTSCGAKLIAVQQSFCESDFEVMGVEQPAPIQFPKSDPESVFSSFAAPKDNQPSESDNNDRDILFVSFTPFDNEDDAAEGTLVAGNTYAGEPNEGGGGIDRPAYISGTAGTPEELRYQAELEAMYINLGGDETKFREGVKKIAARDMLAFDILTLPAGFAVKSAQAAVKAGQYVIRSKFSFPMKRVVDSAKIKRAENYKKFSPNWSKGSLKDSHEKFTPNAEGVLSKDGVKTRYTSDSHTIIKDNENNYFRIYDNTRKQYVSPNGKPPPTGGLKGKEAKDHMQKQTHLRNTD